MILLILWLLLQTCWMQNKVLPVALDKISNTIGTEVKAEHIDIDFFEQITLNDIVIDDNAGSPIVKASSLTIDLSFFSLWKKTLMIDDIILDGATISLKTNGGTSNYQHILDHLAGTESDKTSETSSSDNSWMLGLDDIIISNSRISVTDEYSEMDIDIKSLEADFSGVPTADTIALDHLTADGLQVRINQLAQNPQESKTTQFPSLPVSLQIKHTKITESTLQIEKLAEPSPSGMVDFQHLDVTDIELDANDLTWSDQITADIIQLTAREQSGFQLDRLNGHLKFDDQELVIRDLEIQTPETVITGRVESKYSSFDQLVTDFSSANTTVNLTKGKISRRDIARFVDINQLSTVNLNVINRLNYTGKVTVNSRGIGLMINQLSLDNNLTASGKMDITTDAPASYDLALRNINTTDNYLKRLLPTLEFPQDLKPQGRIRGDISAIGTQDKINISSADLTVSDHTVFKGSGTISDMQSGNPKYDLAIDKLMTRASDLFVQPGNIPEQLFRLGTIEYAGTLQGSTRQFAPNGTLQSDLGDVTIDGAIDFNDDYSDAVYQGSFDIDSFDVGMLIADPKFGIVTSRGSIDGRGFDTETMDVTADVMSERFDYDGETYTDVTIDGRFADNSFEGILKSEDKKLNLDFEGKAILDGQKTAIEFNSALDRIDLRRFGIGDSILWVSGTLLGNFEGNTVDNVIGEGEIKSLQIGTEHGVYTADTSITFVSRNTTDGEKEYILKSELVDATITGNIKVSEIADVVLDYVRDYIPIESGFEETAYQELPSNYDDQLFYLDVKIKDATPLLDVLTNNKLQVKSGKLGGYFSNYDAEADIKGSLDSLIYDDYLINNIDFFFDGREEFINGNLIVEDISSDGEILISEAYLSTIFNDNIAEVNLELYDKEDNQTLALGADISRTDEIVTHFHDTLYINEAPWNFSEYNEVVYGNDGLYMQDVRIFKDDQAITAYTDENENGQAIEILLDNFSLSELTTIIGRENEYLESRINGGLIINNIWNKPFITADLQLNDIEVASNHIGKLTIESTQNTETNTVTSDIVLKGSENDAKLHLDYSIATSELKGQLNIKTLQMSALDPLFPEVIKDSEGSIRGDVDISGTVSKPSINGKLNFKDVITTPIFTNNRIRLSDGEIALSDRRIDLAPMDIYDDDDNVAILSGGINHNHLEEFFFDLQLKTNKFKFLNTTATENPVFYGKVTIAGEIQVQGPTDAVSIDGTARAIDNSTLSLSPFTSDEVDLGNDFIIYGDPRKLSLDSLEQGQLETKNTIPFDVDVKLSVAEDSKFEMIMNPDTGDKITGQGNANLIFNLKRSGDIELYGTYIVTSGDYLFTFGAINKVFDITPGSTVIFNGDPLKGILDVKAVYKTSAAVYDLIALEIDDGFDDSKEAEARRKRDINVVLDITKEIVNPEIKMDITTPSQDLDNSSDLSDISNILDSKLQELRADPDELNRQVFGLMLFDNFMLASNSTTDLAETSTDLAIRSLSGLVTRELNTLANDLIKGVELDINVNSYSSDVISSGEGGLVTEVGVGIKKNLFDDRLSIKIGSNVDLETTSSEAAVFNNIAGDFVVEYKIEKDGTLVARGFRKSNFDRIADENAFKNGVSIFIRKKFGTIKRKNVE